eukprot:1004533_1
MASEILSFHESETEKSISIPEIPETDAEEDAFTVSGSESNSTDISFTESPPDNATRLRENSPKPKSIPQDPPEPARQASTESVMQSYGLETLSSSSESEIEVSVPSQKSEVSESDLGQRDKVESIASESEIESIPESYSSYGSSQAQVSSVLTTSPRTKEIEPTTQQENQPDEMTEKPGHIIDKVNKASPRSSIASSESLHSSSFSSVEEKLSEHDEIEPSSTENRPERTQKHENPELLTFRSSISSETLGTQYASKQEVG